MSLDSTEVLKIRKAFIELNTCRVVDAQKDTIIGNSENRIIMLRDLVEIRSNELADSTIALEGVRRENNSLSGKVLRVVASRKWWIVAAIAEAAYIVFAATR